MGFKKTVKDFLAISLICVILYVIFKVIFLLLLKYAHYTNPTLRLFVYSLIITFLLYAVTYKRLWTLNALKGNLKTTGFYIGVFLVIFFIMGAIKSTGEVNILYHYVVSDRKARGWRGVVNEVDDTLGFKPIPGAKGFHTFPYGDDIPMRYDDRGFRVPVTDDTLSTASKPADILFLGCSYTYGDACYAEETFSYLVAKEAHLNYINAGVCSYGLSHMLILARKLIPMYKPKYVVIQYSPWLVQRGTNIYAPSYIGLITNPYFTDNNNVVGMRPPVFRNYFMSINKEELRKEYKGRYLSFYFSYGLPLVLKQDIADMKTQVSLFFHHDKKPASDKAAVEQYAYNEIIRIANENGSKPIVLKIGDLNNNDFTRFAGASYANADSALNAYLHSFNPAKTSDIYKHWRFNGKDSVMVDEHPNAIAHAIIAQSIISQIK